MAHIAHSLSSSLMCLLEYARPLQGVDGTWGHMMTVVVINCRTQQLLLNVHIIKIIDEAADGSTLCMGS